MKQNKSKICYCNITYKCNNWCTNCISYNVKKRTMREVTLDDYLFFAQHFGIKENDVWTISGGEPTLSSQFRDIIAFCNGCSRHINLYSNGRLLNTLPTCTLNKIERIIVPVYGGKNVHNAYVNNPIAYQETMASLKHVIKNNRHLIDIKILFHKDMDTESLFQSQEWDFLCSNEHFSITRIIDAKQSLMDLKRIVDRASGIISKLIDMDKSVRFYDLPVCMMSDELQKQLKSYPVESQNFETQVICGSSDRRYKLYSFAKPTNILEECSNCKSRFMCSMIMQNYFCPMVKEGKITITTE